MRYVAKEGMLDVSNLEKVNNYILLDFFSKFSLFDFWRVKYYQNVAPNFHLGYFIKMR